MCSLYKFLTYITVFDTYVFLMIPFVIKTVIDKNPEIREDVFQIMYDYLVCKYSIAIIRFCIENETREARLYLSDSADTNKLKKIILMFGLLLPSYITIPVLTFYYVYTEDL